ncbi:MAG: HAD-IA family hydrolase [Phycisphaerae bacterium]
MIKVLVLDFDGLVVESEAIKDAAFVEVFPEFPKHHEAIRAYHLANKHLVRYAKFRHIVQNILGRPYTPEDERRIAEVYARRTRQAIVACPFVPGAPEFLAHFAGRAPMYLASATPQDELRIIVEARGLDRYFKGIYGAPHRKPDILREVMAAEGAPPDQTVFIGDSRADMHAAEAAGVPFVARNHKDDFSGCGVPRFDDLHGIRAYLAPLVASASKETA